MLAGEAGIDVRDAALRHALTDIGSVIVAFSGGVDSAYLAWAATRELGASALCITADSPSYSAHHRALATRIAREFGLRHEIISTNEMARPEYRRNSSDRCYHCKRELYSVLSAMAVDRGFAGVIDGTNADDRSDHRPGRAAAREFGVRSPLDEADLTKHDIRDLARRAGLPVWDEPASACLSSRIPYQSEVTEQKLRMIESAEDALRALGFRVARVRHHESVARIELGRDEMARALDPDLGGAITRELKAVGFEYVALDLLGYRRGSLSEPIRLNPIP